MFLQTYINAHCVISNNRVIKNEQVLFETVETDIPAFLIEAYRHFNLQYPKFFKMDSLSKLGWLACEVLLQHDFNKSKYQPEDIGIVLSNANSSLDTDIKYFETTKTMASPAQFVYTLPNIVIGEISIRHQFKGENAFFISEQFNTAFIHQYVSDLLQNNTMQCCICGWVDVLEKGYTGSLFLIEREKSANSVIFTEENLNNIYQLQNG